MESDLVKRFLVLACDVSYVEQATQTNRLIVAFTDLFRHCNNDSPITSLYSELKALGNFLTEMRANAADFGNITVENHKEYKSIEIPRGIFVDYFQEILSQDEEISGELRYDAESGTLYLYDESEKDL